MFKLYNLYNQVILEAVQRDNILDAIRQRRIVTITYNDGSGEATEKRTLEVYVYGTLHNGKPAIRAYQKFGPSRSSIEKDPDTGEPILNKSGNQKPVPKWKTFLVDKILTWETTNMKFYTPIHDRDNDYMMIKYREDGGDKMFGSIFASADFDDKYRKKKGLNVPVQGTQPTDVGQTQPGIQKPQSEPAYDEYEHEPYPNDYAEEEPIDNTSYEKEPVREPSQEEEPITTTSFDEPENEYEEEDIEDEEEVRY